MSSQRDLNQMQRTNFKTRALQRKLNHIDPPISQPGQVIVPFNYAANTYMINLGDLAFTQNKITMQDIHDVCSEATNIRSKAMPTKRRFIACFFTLVAILGPVWAILHPSEDSLMVSFKISGAQN